MSSSLRATNGCDHGAGRHLQLRRLAGKLNAVGYDLVIDLHGQFRTAVFACATGAPVRIGFDRPRARVWEASERVLPAAARKHAWSGAREGSWLAYTHHIRVPTLDVHAVDRYLSVGPMLGLDNGAADFSFTIPDSASMRIEALLHRHGIGDRLLTIAPGTIWETKHWLSERFAEVARHFIQNGFGVALMGSGREVPICTEVATAAPGVANLAGQTSLPELAALIRRSTICLTNDSGPMHLAVALARPVVSVFGPTDAVWIGPYRRHDAVRERACRARHAIFGCSAAAHDPRACVRSPVEVIAASRRARRAARASRSCAWGGQNRLKPSLQCIEAVCPRGRYWCTAREIRALKHSIKRAFPTSINSSGTL
jgi:ADP-heptose:LPS heptosyltransferase